MRMFQHHASKRCRLSPFSHANLSHIANKRCRFGPIPMQPFPHAHSFCTKAHSPCKPFRTSQVSAADLAAPESAADSVNLATQFPRRLPRGGGGQWRPDPSGSLAGLWGPVPCGNLCRSRGTGRADRESRGNLAASGQDDAYHSHIDSARLQSFSESNVLPQSIGLALVQENVLSKSGLRGRALVQQNVLPKSGL